MSLPFDPPDYKEYRNPKFERFISNLAVGVTTMINSIAALWFTQHIGLLCAWCSMWLYFLIGRMKTQTIYFSDDKDLGPGWVHILIEDLSHSFRYTCVVMICSGVFQMIHDWLCLID